MDALFDHFTAIARQFVSTRESYSTRGIVGKVAAFVTMLVAGTAAIICSLASLWIGLLPYVGPAGAPLVVASASLLVVAAAYGVHRTIRGKRHSPTSASNPMALLLVEVASSMSEHRGIALLTALAAGLTAGITKK